MRLNIKIPEHGQTSKKLEWKDSQLYQKQAAVEPEYCRVKVVRQIMMMMTMIKALMLTKHYALTKVIALFIT